MRDRCVLCGKSSIEVAKMCYFPTNFERAKKWFDALHFGIQNDWQNLRLCIDHFDSNMYDSSKKLYRTAVPKTIGNLCGNPNNSRGMQNKFDDCIDDKMCIYETVVRGGNIKQESCDMEDKQGSVDNYVNIKKENTTDQTVVVQESILKTMLMTDSKEDYRIYCDECGEKYDLFCPKCPMLIRIFDGNKPNWRDNTVKQTLPTNFIDIRETPSGASVIALRAIPNGVVFGPFEGLDSIKDGIVSKWRLTDKELAYTKDPKRLNWMQYIRRAGQSSHRNLTPFQYEDRLYYRSICHIDVDDELLVCWNSRSEESGRQDVVDSYWKPQVCEKLDDTYACTLCCVGYKSLHHLGVHNSRCLKKRNQKDFCKEIIQCAFCKIYLDKEEYSEYHLNRCSESNPKKYVAAPRSPEDTDKPQPKDKNKCSMCEYSTSQESKFRRHQLTHRDLRMYKCPECPYRARRKYCLQKHTRKHTNCSPSRFECEHCSERFARFELFAVHQKKKHAVSVYKCDKCVFETMNARNFVRHQATHEYKPYRCNTCGKQFNLEKTLLRHVRNLHNEKKKKYKCPKCDFITIHPGNMKKHLLNIHSGVKRFKCPRCAFKTCYKKHLELHLRYHEDVKSIKCESCDREFWNIQLLIRHKKEIHAITDKTYSCSKCEYRTNRYYTFNQHILRVHDGSKHFECTLCPYKTTTNSNLSRHIATHNDDKPFACTLCPYKATTNWILKQHVTVHGLDKPFTCSLCPYKTALKSALTRHVAIHRDDKPFKCDMCPQMFKLKAALTKHARNVHSQSEEREFKCPQCSFETNYKASFKRHVNAHDDSELFECSKCHFNTHHKGHFARHMKVLHVSAVKEAAPLIDYD